MSRKDRAHALPVKACVAAPKLEFWLEYFRHSRPEARKRKSSHAGNCRPSSAWCGTPAPDGHQLSCPTLARKLLIHPSWRLPLTLRALGGNREDNFRQCCSGSSCVSGSCPNRPNSAELGQIGPANSCRNWSDLRHFCLVFLQSWSIPGQLQHDLATSDPHKANSVQFGLRAAQFQHKSTKHDSGPNLSGFGRAWWTSGQISAAEQSLSTCSTLTPSEISGRHVCGCWPCTGARHTRLLRSRARFHGLDVHHDGRSARGGR